MGIQPGGCRLRIEAGDWAAECPVGASVAVSGICLTVVSATGCDLEFDVIHETLRRSNLGETRTGGLVNLERSLRIGDRMDGHFVQGHVDGTATVEEVRAADEDYVILLRPDESLIPYIIPKGAICIEGASLTIADIGEQGFTVALIPTTLARTNLGSLRVGDAVNIETDVMARTIVHCLSKAAYAGLFKPELVCEI